MTCHHVTTPRKTLKASRCGSQDLLFKFTCHQISNFNQGCPLPPSITVELTTASASNSSAFPCPASPCHTQIFMPTSSIHPVTPELLSASLVPPPLFDLAGLNLFSTSQPRKTPVSPATVYSACTQVPGTQPLGYDQLLTVAGPGGDLGQVSLLYRKVLCNAAGAKHREPPRLQQVTGEPIVREIPSGFWEHKSIRRVSKGTMRSEAEGDMDQV